MTQQADRRISQHKYFQKNPWAKSYRSTFVNARKRGFEHTMKVKDFKELWFRDKAYLMKKRSVDRIDSSKGYIKENCRYMELHENISREVKGRKSALRKLSEKDIANIHKLLFAKIPQRKIASKYGVTQNIIYCINTGKTYTI